MKKKKLIHVLNTGSFSGAENVVITIINNSREFCDSVYVALNGSISNILDDNNIKYMLFDQLSVKNIKCAIKKYNPDVIHAHDFTASVLAAIAAPRGVNVISHLHNNPPWIKKISAKTILYGICSKRYKTILTVSDSVMQEYVFGWICKNKSLVVGNPIDLNYIINKLDSINSADDSDILFLGRLTEQKNPIQFLEYINLLKQDIPEIRVAIVGDGELRNNIVIKIGELGLENNIKLYGFQDNPYNFIDKTKILCMPSLWEGFGLAAIEALAFGKPVIAANVGGLKKIVTEKCGSICNTKNDFVNKMRLCLLDEEMYHEKSIGARNRAKELENIQQYISIIKHVYS